LLYIVKAEDLTQETFLKFVHTLSDYSEQGKPKAFVNHTAEMELSTIFTLPQVLLSRMTLLGMTNILILSFASIMTTLYLSVNLIHSFMYFCVPFFITSLGCLFILNHIHTKECNYYCGGWSIVIMCLLFALSRALPILYETSLTGCWCLLFVITLLGVLFECKMLIRNCQKDALKKADQTAFRTCIPFGCIQKKNKNLLRPVPVQRILILSPGQSCL